MNQRVVRMVDKDIPGIGKVHLGVLISLETLVVVQMFLKKIEQNADMRSGFCLFELVRRKLAHNASVVADFVDDVEQGNPHIAGQYAGQERAQQMMGQQRGGAFALGSRNADNLLGIGVQKKVGLRTHLGIGKQLGIIFKRDARGLEHQVDFGHSGKQLRQIVLAGGEHQVLVVGEKRMIPDIGIGIHQKKRLFGKKAADKGVGTQTLASQAHNGDVFCLFKERTEFSLGFFRKRIMDTVAGILPLAHFFHGIL